MYVTKFIIFILFSLTLLDTIFTYYRCIIFCAYMLAQSGSFEKDVEENGFYGARLVIYIYIQI